MEPTLTSKAEQSALLAESLPAFSGVKLLNIKKNLALLLELIGREQIFSEYTRHDISHIDRMLAMLDWLIPDVTRELLTPSDWLMTVLAIYFHDLGMLVTKKEYEARSRSGFPEYRDTVLLVGDKAADYQAKIADMGEDIGERFLYQEFVRSTHAERIRAWVTGQLREKLGISADAVAVIDDLLSDFDDGFREDLALVCESHHLDDLKDFKKYKVRRPYGNFEEETVNLQYAAVLMRTTDLLHITKDRTPTTSFRLINPADPISQEEWAKQMAVITVRSQFGRDTEGNLDSQAPRDTIEVHARFTKKEGFFALTSYLLYANEQIRRSYDAVKLSNKTQGVHHEFPWRKIDDNNIETIGFMRETFGFTIDQPRILKLLTGHTLYNDTNVVLRELVQNALDAVRLQTVIDGSLPPTGRPSILISYDTANRVLTVKDYGTGMSQEVVERNLLTVGASRYEDPEFKKRYPNFSAISRFGIGILSTFMIADTVEIVTCSPEDEQARQLSLRSVLGRYLIRLLDKDKDDEAIDLMPHGTLVRLTIRHSAQSPDVLAIAQRWIVVPECEVTVSIDGSHPVRIGSTSPKEALEKVLAGAGITVDSDPASSPLRPISVRQAQQNGITVAYAVVWSEYFQQWSFMDADALIGSRETALGTCVEGVRVEFGSPGFDGSSIVALANATGRTAPKTNVARSGLEVTDERNAMLASIYSIYCDHVKSEVNALHKERAYSLTWAVRESRYILGSLLRSRGFSRDTNLPLDRKILFEQIRRLPIALVERDGKRQGLSPAFLEDEPSLWTVYSPSFNTAEFLIREVPGDLSLSALATSFHIDLALPPGIILCGVNPADELDSLSLSGKELDKIIINREHRTINLRWSRKRNPSRWRFISKDLKLPSEIRELISRLETLYGFGRESISNIFVARDSFDVSGLTDGEVGIRSYGQIYLSAESPIATIINKTFDRYESEKTSTSLQALATAVIVGSLAAKYYSGSDFSRLLRVVSEFESLREMQELSELRTALLSPLKVYDPSAWSRGLREISF